MSRKRVDGDDGVGLIEVLVAITLLGIGGVAVLSGLAASIRLSDRHQDHADSTSVLVGAAEVVKSGVLYTPCAGSNADEAEATYAAHLQANAVLPDGWAATDIDLEVVQCAGAGGVQHITLSSTAPSTGVTDEFSFAKGDRAVTPPENPPEPGSTASDCVSPSGGKIKVDSNDDELEIKISIPSSQFDCTGPIVATVTRLNQTPSTDYITLTQHMAAKWEGTADIPAGCGCTLTIRILDSDNPRGTIWSGNVTVA